VALLQEVAGPCYGVLFLKSGRPDWSPVGAENLYSTVSGKDGTSAVVLCDGDGNTKAMSAWVAASEADRLVRALEAKGLPMYSGELRLPI